MSRQAVHRWLAWYRDEGLPGLADGWHRPHAHPAQTSPEVEAAICELRRNHPSWGQRRLHYESGRNKTHAGLTVTIYPSDTTFRVQDGDQVLTQAPRTATKPVARFKARKPRAATRACDSHENVDTMTAPDGLPTMATAMPEVTAALIRLLRDLDHEDLATPLPSQHFHGRCQCRPGCTFALTAAQGASGTLMVWLEVGGEPIGQASLDPDGRTITDFDIDRPRAIGHRPDWLDRAVQPSPTTQDRT